MKNTLYKAVVTGNLHEIYRYEKPVFFDIHRNKTDKEKSIVSDEERAERQRLYMLASSYRAVTKMKRLIQGNMHQYGDYRPKFLTLTFDPKKVGQMTNLKDANKHFKQFIQRYNYYIQKKFQIKSTLAYLSVPEYQDDFYYNTQIRKPDGGLIHYHMILFNSPVIDKMVIENDIWGLGGTTIKAVNKGKGLFLYLSKYISKSFLDPRYKGKKRFFYSLDKQTFIKRDIWEVVSIMRNIKETDLTYTHKPKLMYDWKFKDKETRLKYPINTVHKKEYMVGIGGVGGVVSPP